MALHSFRIRLGIPSGPVALDISTLHGCVASSKLHRCVALLLLRWLCRTVGKRKSLRRWTRQGSSRFEQYERQNRNRC